jgi:hypothetical protein
MMAWFISSITYSTSKYGAPLRRGWAIGVNENTGEWGCYSLAGQPLHKTEEGSGIIPIRELFQCLAVTRRVQNHTRT